MPSVAQFDLDDLIVGNIHVTGLSDAELYRRLLEFKIPVGPIVDSTRQLYQRKLYDLLAANAKSDDTYVVADPIPSSVNHNSPVMERRRKDLNVAATVQQIDYDSDTYEPLDEDYVVADISRSETTPDTAPTPHQQLYPILDALSTPLVIPPTPITPQTQPPLAPTPQPPVSLAVPSNRDYRYYSPAESSVGDATTPDRSPYYPTVRRSMYNGETPPSYSTSTSDFDSYSRNSVNWRKNRSDRAADPSTRNAAESKKKNHKWQTTIFEVFLVLFLLVVGYIFYREIQMYADAEQEFMDSQAQNLNVDQ